MAVRIPIDQAEGLYFITFTCCDSLPLFEITDGFLQGRVSTPSQAAEQDTDDET
jgi:hypothetical protein